MNKPQVAGTSPQMEDLEEGKSYAWCACGVANAQPWCDGAHKAGDLRPHVFKAEASEKRAMCMCKQTNNPPFCDGSHSKLPADTTISGGAGAVKKEITKKYSNGEITVHWKPQKCIHSEVCVKTLPGVYKPKESPWISVDKASSEELRSQVNSCPSGALTYTEDK